MLIFHNATACRAWANRHAFVLAGAKRASVGVDSGGAGQLA
jgi:hypothetical protein